MKLVLVFLVAFALLTFAGEGIAPTVCAKIESGASALVSFVSDPQPDLILAPGGLVDTILTC